MKTLLPTHRVRVTTPGGAYVLTAAAENAEMAERLRAVFVASGKLAQVSPVVQPPAALRQIA